MVDDAQPRKLATIVALDVAGYSARTEADEDGTTAQVAALRKVIEGIAARHSGRVFNTAGDGFMLEFGSSLAAVEAAFELADICEPKVRVGVHLGDVVVQPNGDLLGHGVNVAARLMAQAVPGSVLVSADVRRSIRGPLPQSLRSKGTIKLAKMSEAIEVFALVPHAPSQRNLLAHLKDIWARNSLLAAKWTVFAGVAVLVLTPIAAWLVLFQQAAPQRGIVEASVAVLPFENLSTDKDNAFFAAGIQDEILTRLTKIGSLKVISHRSTAQLASRPDNLPEIARQLGVANILEGSVQREGDAVRVNVQLIKASTDGHLWAEIYDRKLDNIFSVQSEIATAIAEALNAKVTGEEKQSIALKPTNNAAAYDAYLRGLATFHQNTAAFAKAAESFKEAVRLDPNFALAWALLARMQALIYFHGDATEAQREAARAALDSLHRQRSDLPEVKLAQGFYHYYVEKDYVEAQHQFAQVQASWPNDTESLFALGLIARRQGRWNESKAYFDRVIMRDPLRVDLRQEAATLLIASRDLAAALRLVDDALNFWPQDFGLIEQKVEILQSQGRLDEADALLDSLLQSRPEDYLFFDIAAQASLQRRYQKALAKVQALVGQTSDTILSGEIYLTLGDLFRLSGDAKRATDNYEQARKLIYPQFVQRNYTPDVLRDLAYIYCGLGDRERALKFVSTLIELRQNSKDALEGPAFENIRMRIWARFGDAEHAIPAIGRLLKLRGGFPPTLMPTIALLRLDPDFDKLRGDPRFEKLAAEDVKPK